jgi:hypothetical protein
MFKTESHNKPSHFGRTITVNSSVLYVLFAAVPFRALPVCHSLSLGHSAFLVASGLPTYHLLPHACVGIFFNAFPWSRLPGLLTCLRLRPTKKRTKKRHFPGYGFAPNATPTVQSI